MGFEYLVHSGTLNPGKEKHTSADETHKNYKAAVSIDYNIVFSGGAYFVVIVCLNSIKLLPF